jgi:hypothetical protein
MADIKNMLRGTAAPQVTDDASAGYIAGSKWTWGFRNYACIDATVGAAKWIRTLDNVDAWPSATYRLPDNCNGMFADTTPGVGTDFFGLFPFLVDRPFNQVAVSVSAIGSGGTELRFGAYPHDPVTGKPSTTSRLANIGGGTINSPGLKSFSGATIDVVGLVWISVHCRLVGITTAPTWVTMAGANGRHVHTGSGAELTNKQALYHYTSTDAFTTSPPTPVFNTSAINRGIPCPMILAA